MDTHDFLQPFEHTVQVNIDGHILDYLLSVDLTGHVHHVQPLIFELPTSAQKLILGESDGQLERKIKAYGRLFQFLVPLVLAGKLPNYQEQLGSLVDEIKQRLAQKGILWAQLPSDVLHSTLAFELRKFHTSQNHVDPTTKLVFESIEHIIDHLKDKSQDKLEDKLKNIPALPNSIAADFFPTIIPFLDFYTQAQTFRRMADIKSEQVKNYLLDEIKVPSSEPYISSILHALKTYGAEDNDIFNAVVGFYERSDKQEILGYNLINVLDLLRRYLRPRTKEILLEVLRSNHPSGAWYAAEALLNIGTHQKEIAQEIMPSFKSGNPDVCKVIFKVFMECISEEYLPSADETLNVIANTPLKTTDADTHSIMASLAIKTGVQFLPNRLLELLNHESATVQYRILHMINHFYEKLQRGFEPFKSVRMLACYRNLAKNANTEVAIQAIHLLSKIGQKSDIDLLVGIISKNFQNHPIDEEAMKAINLLIQRIPYPFQIEPCYLEALSNSRYSLRVAALQGLRYSPHFKFKKALADKYKNDPVFSVSEAAKNLLNAPFRSISIRLRELIQKRDTV